MTIVKTHRFSATVRMRESGVARVEAPDKPTFRVAVPPELHGEHPETWSPEELLVSSVASCFSLTLASVAAHRRVPLHDVEVRAAGHVERVDRRYRFTLIEVDATVETDQGRIAEAEEAAERARELCVVGDALDVPVHYRVDVGARPVQEVLLR